MQGRYILTPQPGDVAAYLLAAEDDPGRFRIAPHEVEDAAGKSLTVQRLEGRVLLADPFTGKASASGTFITNNICRPPAAVARHPDLRHYALEAPELGRTEYHLGRGPDGCLGVVLTPDGRQLARIATSGDAGSLEVPTDLDWRAALVALHLTIFEPQPRGIVRRLRTWLRWDRPD